MLGWKITCWRIGSLSNAQECFVCDQWAFQFKLWSTVQHHQISRFTSDSKERFRGSIGVVVTTYNMVAFGAKRSEESQKIIEEIQNREWGLLLMDEVHVVPSTYVPESHQHHKITLQTWAYCLLQLRLAHQEVDGAV